MILQKDAGPLSWREDVEEDGREGGRREGGGGREEEGGCSATRTMGSPIASLP